MFNNKKDYLEFLAESVYRSKYVTSEARRVQFLKEDVQAKEITRFLFALQEAEKSVSSLDRVYQVLSDLSLTTQKELKNKLENSNSNVIKDIFKSKGDITKVDIIAKVRKLLTISIDMNDRFISSADTSYKSRMQTYNSYANRFLTLIDVMARYKNLISKSITNELNKPFEKQFNHQLYVNLVLFIQVFGTAIYSLGIKLLNPTGLSNDYMNRKQSFIVFLSSSEMDETIDICNSCITMVQKGNVFNMRNQKIQEEFMEMVNDKNKVINEGFFDVVASLITNTFIGNILLTPVFLVRSITYLIIFLGSAYKAINDSIDESIRFITSKDATNEESFNRYDRDVKEVAHHSINQLSNSQMALKHEVQKNHSKIKSTLDDSSATKVTPVSNSGLMI